MTMALHRYPLGQTVRFKSRAGMPLKTPDTFEIVGLLPPQNGTCQYRMRSEEERHERVAQEDDIEAVGDISPKQADNSNTPGAAHLR